MLHRIAELHPLGRQFLDLPDRFGNTVEMIANVCFSAAARQTMLAYLREGAAAVGATNVLESGSSSD